MFKKIFTLIVLLNLFQSSAFAKTLYNDGYFYQNNKWSNSQSQDFIKGKIQKNKKQDEIKIKSEIEDVGAFEKKTVSEIKFNTENNIDISSKVTIEKKESVLGLYHDTIEIPEVDFKLKKSISKNIDFHSKLDVNKLGETGSQEILSDTYLTTKIAPNHQMSLGYTTISSGEEFAPEFLNEVDTAQRENRFTSTRDLGVKIGGDLDFMNYSIGAYNGSSQEDETSIATGGWLSFKPLYNAKNKGKLEIGGGYYSDATNQSR